MFEIIKVYTQSVDSFRFIGKKYSDADRTNQTFALKEKWSEWYINKWFDVIEKQLSGNPIDTYEDSSAYIGLLRNKRGEPFQYWIGMFVPVNTKIPEGYDYIDFPRSELGVCWVYGKEDDLSMYEGIEIIEQCNERLIKEEIPHIHDKDGICYAFERYTRPRFITPDNKGNIILDICFFINLYY